MVGYTTIAEACQLVTDGTHYTPKDIGVGFPFLTVKDVTDEKLDFSGCSFISEQDYNAADEGNSAPKFGDVLFSKDGTVGKVHVVTTDRPFAVLSSLAILRPNKDAVDARYLGHALRSPLVLGEALKKKTGSAIRRIILSDLKKVKFPLPALDEQRRIAAILDQAEALRAKRREALAQLDSLAQSIFIEMFGDGEQSPVNASNKNLRHPKGWKWELLTDHAQLATGHTPDREKEEYWNGNIPWISLTDIRSLNGTWALETSQCVTASGIRNSSAVILPRGTVCLSRTASVGFVTVMGREMATSQDFVNWVPGPNLHPVYLMYALMRSKPQLLALSTGSTHKTIYVRVVEQFRALMPPIALQEEFAHRIKAVEASVKLHKQSLVELDPLFASLQHRAFKGEL